MRRAQHAAALGCCAALALGLAGCGSDDSEFDAQPATTPDLIAPEDVTLAEPSGTTTSGTSTTSTAGTTATPATPPASSGAGSGGAVAPATPATPTPPAATPTPTPATPKSGSGTGGAQQPQGNADPGGFSDFCAQNPGACGTDG